MVELLLLLLLGTFACQWIPAPQPRWLLSLGLLAGSGLTAFNLGALSTTGIALGLPTICIRSLLRRRKDGMAVNFPYPLRGTGPDRGLR